VSCAEPGAPPAEELPAGRAAEPGLPARRRLISPRRAVAFAYVSGIFMTAMDMHIVNVTVPTLGRTFGAPLAEVQWTVVAYALSLAVVIPASGWAGDRIGPKRALLIALGLFTLASALCGAAQSLGELIGARILQGVGGGMLTPVATALLFRTYPPRQRARVIRTLIVPILVAPASAPLLGGFLTQSLSWRWVFLVNIPVGLATLLLCALYLEDAREHVAGRLDVTGMVLGATGLSALIYAISEGPDRGWASGEIVASGIGGLAVFAIFVRFELRHPDPLLRLHLLGDRLFRSTQVVFALTSGAFLGVLYLTPIFLQEVHHQSPLGSGSTTFVEALGVAAASQPVGRLYMRLGPRVMMGFGALGVTVLLIAFSFVDGHTNLWTIRLLLFLMGAINGAVFLSVQNSMFATISAEDTGHASAIYTAQRQASIATGIAILTTIVASERHSQLAGFQHAYLGAAALMLLGAIGTGLLVHTEDARATMRPRDALGARVA
jgi:EmrB/QacA subfamily drug resistance transporter